MSLIDRFKNWVGLATKSVPTTQQGQRMMQKEKHLWSNEKYLRVDIDIQNWRDAINECFAPPYYDHVRLYELYEKAYLDDNIFAQMETRINGTLAEPFALYDKSGKKNEKATELLQATWVNELNKTILESIFWGAKVVQFSYEDLFKNNAFTKFDKIENLCINPRRKVFLSNPYVDNIGVSLETFELVLMFGKAGSLSDLGLFVRPARRVIYKDYTFSDWARFNEKFAVPYRYAKTDTSNKKQKDDYMKALENWGENGYGVFDMEDEIGALFPSGTGSIDSFEKFINLCDSQASKSLIGQTATSDQKSFVGSAEVQERKLDWWVEKDMYFVQNTWKDIVLPFLASQGRAYQGIDQYKFEFEFFYDKKNKKETTPVQPDQKKDEKGNLSLESDCCDDDYPFGKA